MFTLDGRSITKLTKYIITSKCRLKIMFFPLNICKPGVSTRDDKKKVDKPNNGNKFVGL